LSEDKELERILEEKRKRLMNRLAKSSEKSEKTTPQRTFDDVDKTVLSLLDDKGREILSLAEQNFPEETKRAKLLLYALVKKGYVDGAVDAGDLYRFLRYLGIPVRYESRIMVADGRERKPLSEILSERMSELE
jgi:DNA-binding TFAR19-related protein (PDSD5 family)